VRLLPSRGGRARKLPKLNSRPQRWLLRYGWLLPILALVIGGGILALTYAFASIPLPKDIKLSSSAEVFDRNGVRIGTYSNEIHRFLIDTTELPKFVGQAVVAAEDKEFYEHGGISLKGILRAAWANLTGGEIQQGGSTIAQQYIKNAVLEDPERTITRKIKEAILAIKLERRYSKQQILGFYLNTIYLGRGTYGVEAASRSYFGHPAEEMSLAEAAFLAGIIPSPESYRPERDAVAAKARRDRVLDLMAEEGYISEERAERASRAKVKVEPVTRRQVENQKAAYFMEWLRKKYLYPEYGNRLYTSGLKIYTTLDLKMQASAEDAVASVLTEKEDPQAAVVSMTPDGAVRAFVGGRDFRDVAKARGFSYASDPPGRSPGSSFKPWTLLTAVDEGISPTSTFSGRSPYTYPVDPCGPNPPVENYGGSSYGTMTLDQATTNSVNTVYAQLIAQVGPDKVADMLEDLGFDQNNFTDKPDPIDPHCSLSLGSFDATPVQQARAYAALANGGVLPEVQPIVHIDDSHGNCLKSYRPVQDLECAEEDPLDTKRVVDENTADVVTQVLTHVVEGGTATAADIGRPVAGKTGTAQDNVDAWFGGYIPQLATVVWEGYPIDKRNGEAYRPLMQSCADVELCRPVHGYTVTGGGTPVSPAVIWATYMREAVLELEVQPFPTPSAIPTRVIRSPGPVYTGPPPPGESEPPTEKPRETKPPPPPPPSPPPPSEPPPPTVVITPTAAPRRE
jgi:penicillin-binding protein 1A